MPQLLTLTRDQFLAATIMTSATLDRRAHDGELALALGLERPARRGTYLVLDIPATILCSWLNCRAGLELKAAAAIVRENWDEPDGWLNLLATAQARPLPNHAELFIAIADKGGASERRYRVLLGDMPTIAAACQSDVTNFISLHRLLRQVYANAKHAGIQLPQRLALAHGEKGFADFRREIDAYREAAGARVAKAKAQHELRHAAFPA